ncbi:hypothetical protein AB0872_22085 [Microbacterium sp. NPDC047426]
MSDVDNERFHLVLSARGKPVMHGWWGRKRTAEHQYLPGRRGGTAADRG